ncbi:hypothetical protein B0O80DRAFT_458943 [Mortierella sp. GBAus27b]|nr:hypothetical protein B0O80DRAFT_458943 [Mortierella sp. GBAus27b]
MAPPAQGPSSSASEIQNQTDSSASITTSTTGQSAVNVKKNSGARTTNVSFLARLTGRQRPERDARRMLQSTIDGVFSNMSAKPRVEKPHEEELPPSYKTVAMDVSPAYYETSVIAPGFTDDDELLVDGLPVGGLFGFMWNMIISMSFRFVGFFLTYLLHTSHATKQGSKTGLGITFISIGYNMMNGRLPDADDTMDEDSDTGYMGNTDSSPSSVLSLRSWTEYMWLSYFLIFLGSVIMVQSLLAFAKAKRAEMVITTQTTAALEATVPANAAAGLVSTLACMATNWTPSRSPAAGLVSTSAYMAANWTYPTPSRSGSSSGTLTSVPLATFSNTSTPRPGLDSDGGGPASGSRSSRPLIIVMD